MSSSNEQERVRSLAARVASRLAEKTNDGGDDRRTTAGPKEMLGRELAALREGMTEIKRRLAHLETHVGGAEACEPENVAEQQRPTHPSRLSNRAAVAQGTNASPRLTTSTYVPVNAPSEDHFEVNEAVSELADYFERGKVCTLEPGGKPCDHCSMCSSRGF